MAKLFKQIVLLLVISFPVFFLFKFILRDYQQKNYNSAFVDKLKILQSNRLTRKIVLIGGSSVGWGLSAELIEKQLSIKTINLGHHAGFGLVDFQSFIMKNISKDDIIVFSPEWDYYCNPTATGKATLDNLIKYNHEYGELLGNNYYILKSFCSKIKLKFSEPDNQSPPYQYNCLNKNGDVISQCNLKAQGPKYYKIESGSLKIDSFPTYFPFLQNNKTIFVFPPTQLPVYDENKDYLDLIEKTLLQKNYFVSDHVIDNVYPDSSFFDAEYHLKCDVRTSRTEKLIAYLRQIIK